MADKTELPDKPGADGAVTPPELPSGSSRRKVVALLGAVLLVIVLFAAAGSYFLFFSSEKQAPEEISSRVVPEAIGPRSILEGLDKLQNAYVEAEKMYSADLAELVARYAKDEKVFTPAWKAAVSNELSKSNLVVRTLPDGFEMALRQGEKRWLVYSRLGREAPKIATQETDGAPPFGAEESPQPAEAGHVQQVDLEEYRDPQNFFSVMLPRGFTASPSGAGPTVRVTFSYTNAVRLSFKAMESNRGWEPLTELAVKAEQIRAGHVPAFADFRLAVTNLLDVEGGTGYEMGLVGVGAKAGVYTHTFALGGERTLLSVAVLCPSPSGRELYESILAALRDTLRIGTGPVRKGVVLRLGKEGAPAGATTTEPQKPPEPRPLTPEEEKEWIEAHSQLKTSGIMRSGDAYVAIVNGQLVRVGDAVSVTIKNKTFKFTVSEITVDEVKFERVLKGSDASVGNKSL